MSGSDSILHYEWIRVNESFALEEGSWFEVHFNSCRFASTDGAAAANLCSLLASCAAPRLRITHCRLQPSFLCGLSAFLVELTHLDLSSNALDASACAALAHLLRSGYLRSLSVARNSLADEGCSVLAQALIGNASLVRLDLSQNNIGRPGAVSLRDVLLNKKNCTSLECLNFTANSAGAAEPMLQLIQPDNNVLRVLLLSAMGNYVLQGELGRQVANHLSKNTCLQRVSLPQVNHWYYSTKIANSNYSLIDVQPMSIFTWIYIERNIKIRRRITLAVYCWAAMARRRRLPRLVTLLVARIVYCSADAIWCED